MKKKANSFALGLIACCIVLQGYAQAPQLINYQGVARNGTEILLNKTIELQFTIHDLNTGGTPLYSETQSVTTNSYGIFTVKIGNGTIVAGSFDAIIWGTNSKFLEVDIDTSNTGAFSTLATTQLLSVPYALYANKADSAAYAPQTLYTAGQGVTITGTTINLRDTIPQTLSLSASGDSLTISKGNAINMALLVPPGTIQAFGGATAPAGWLLCDGSTYPTTGQYASLYNVIGFNFGGSGLKFNVPEFRGLFLRGAQTTVANNLGVVTNYDPDASVRGVMNIGGNSGANVGSEELDALSNHQHYATQDGGNTNNTNVQVAIATSTTTGTYVQENGVVVSNNFPAGGTIIPSTSNYSTETRPKNAYVNYIIKY